MATKQQQDSADTDAVLGRVLKNFAQDEKAHSAFAKNVEDQYKAYQGILEAKSKAAGWTSRQHSPYIHQVVETMLASMIDPSPVWSVKPRPMLADAAKIDQLTQGAQANEWLLNQQSSCDRLGEKQPVFAKQAIITGLSVYKTFWSYKEAPSQRQAVTHEPVYAGDQVIGHAPKVGVEKYTKTMSDDNTVEVVDVRDFIWHEAAVSLEKAKRVTHRILYSMEELKALERLGVYKNISKLYDTDDTSPDGSSREQDLFQANRQKDMVEVLEQWWRTEDGGMRVTSIGNRAVLLRDVPNPFWHGQFPFVICSAVPDLFRIPGVSIVELIRDIQEAIWSFSNQRLDGTQLLNNPVVLIREDADDYEQFEWAPGAQWVVQDPGQVSLLQINPTPVEISLKAEEILKQDLQNIPGASPALLGQIDNSATTATEVSLTTSLGQRRLAAMKQQFKFAHARVGEQWISNNQQFLTNDREVAVVGAGGAQAFQKVSPLMIQGEYVISLEAMDESLMKQQKTAEANARLQVALTAVMPMHALPGQPDINVKAYVDDVLKAAGINNTEPYFLPKQEMQAPPGGPGPQQPGQPQQNGNGVTAPQASDMNSPSHPQSQSPAADMQQMLAMGGGAQNSPAG